MKELKKVSNFLAGIYVVICLLQVLIFPREFLGFVDNLFFVFALLHVVLESATNKESRHFLLMFFVFFIWTFVSQAFSQYNNGWLSNLSYQLIFLKMACVLIISKGFIEKAEKPHVIRTIIDYVFFLLVFFNLFVAFNPCGVGELIQNAYTSSNFTDFVYYHEPGVFRLAGTQLNPNNNAIVWMCFVVYYLQFLNKKWALFLIALGILFLTQSRTNVIALVICLFIYFMIHFWKKGNWKRLIYFGLPMMVVGLLFVLKSSYLKSLFTGDAFASHSFLARLENYMHLSNYSFFELFTGKGVINKPIDTIGFSMDSEYLGVIFQFGIIGLVCWIGNIITLIKWNKDKNQMMYFLILLVLINSFTNLTFLNLQIGVVLIFFFAISLKVKTLSK